jgi:UDP-N-acetyl-2-amino-2-deoxyglucuronate dehydrogenase
MGELNNGKIRFAIVGYGHIGKRHEAMIKSNQECELVSVCDNNPDEKAKWKEQGIRFFCTLDEMLDAGPEFDVLCVATPNGLHEEQAIKGLRTGHHVVIEKPMALTKAGCEHIIFDAEQVFTTFRLVEGCDAKKIAGRYLHGTDQLLLEP